MKILLYFILINVYINTIFAFDTCEELAEKVGSNKSVFEKVRKLTESKVILFNRGYFIDETDQNLQKEITTKTYFAITFLDTYLDKRSRNYVFDAKIHQVLSRFGTIEDPSKFNQLRITCRDHYIEFSIYNGVLDVQYRIKLSSLKPKMEPSSAEFLSSYLTEESPLLSSSKEEIEKEKKEEEDFGENFEEIPDFFMLLKNNKTGYFEINSTEFLTAINNAKVLTDSLKEVSGDSKFVIHLLGESKEMLSTFKYYKAELFFYTNNIENLHLISKHVLIGDTIDKNHSFMIDLRVLFDVKEGDDLNFESAVNFIIEPSQLKLIKHRDRANSDSNVPLRELNNSSPNSDGKSSFYTSITLRHDFFKNATSKYVIISQNSIQKNALATYLNEEQSSMSYDSQDLGKNAKIAIYIKKETADDLNLVVDLVEYNGENPLVFNTTILRDLNVVYDYKKESVKLILPNQREIEYKVSQMSVFETSLCEKFMNDLSNSRRKAIYIDGTNINVDGIKSWTLLLTNRINAIEFEYQALLRKVIENEKSQQLLNKQVVVVECYENIKNNKTFLKIKESSGPIYEVELTNVEIISLRTSDQLLKWRESLKSEDVLSQETSKKKVLMK